MQNIGQSAKNHKIVQWVYNIVVAVSKMLYTIGGGSPDASISQMLGYRKIKDKDTWWSKPLRRIVDCSFMIFFNEKNHCVNSMIGESYVRGLWSIDKELSKQLAERAIHCIDNHKKLHAKERFL